MARETRFYPDDLPNRIMFVPTVVDPASPTVDELTAGVDLTPYLRPLSRYERFRNRMERWKSRMRGALQVLRGQATVHTPDSLEDIRQAAMDEALDERGW